MPYDATTFEPQTEADVCRGRMLQLRDFLAGLDEARFDMRRWRADAADLAPWSQGECGTVACIGGWAEILFGGEDDMGKAGALLGLSVLESVRLFAPYGIFERWGEITTAQAVQVLDHYLATGEIDWTVAL
jgi:hypothetical protein